MLNLDLLQRQINSKWARRNDISISTRLWRIWCTFCRDYRGYQLWQAWVKTTNRHNSLKMLQMSALCFPIGSIGFHFGFNVQVLILIIPHSHRSVHHAHKDFNFVLTWLFIFNSYDSIRDWSCKKEIMKNIDCVIKGSF